MSLTQILAEKTVFVQALDIKTKHIFYTLFPKMQGILGGLKGQTHFNPNIGRMLHDGVYLFPTD